MIESGLPIGWRVSTIGEVYESWGGHTPSKSNASYWGEGMPWLSSQDIKSPKLTQSTHSVTPTALAETGLRVCPAGSVIVVVRSGILAHTLPVGVTTMDSVINQDLKAFHSGKQTLNDWLALYLRATGQQLLASSRRDGTTVQSLQMPLLTKTQIPIPPEETIRAISSTLSATDLIRESAVQHLASAIAAIDGIRRAVFDAACSGRLTAKWRGQEFDPNNGLPTGWRHARLGDVAEKITKGTTPTSNGHSFTDSGVAFVKVENLRDGYIDRASIESFISAETHRSQERSILKEGDVLFSIAGTIGRTAIVRAADLPANTNQALAIIRSPQRVLIPQYLVVALQSALQAAVADLARGSGMNNISLADVRGLEVAVPPMAEQRRIVAQVEALLLQVEKIKEELQSAQQNLHRVSQAILAAAVRGELNQAMMTSADSRPNQVA